MTGIKQGSQFNVLLAPVPYIKIFTGHSFIHPSSWHEWTNVHVFQMKYMKRLLVRFHCKRVLFLMRGIIIFFRLISYEKIEFLNTFKLALLKFFFLLQGSTRHAFNLSHSLFACFRFCCCSLYVNMTAFN